MVSSSARSLLCRVLSWSRVIASARWASRVRSWSARFFVNAERVLAPFCRLNLHPRGSVCVGAVFGDEIGATVGAVGVSGEGEDFGVVDEAVDHRGRDDVVSECLAPASEG